MMTPAGVCSAHPSAAPRWGRGQLMNRTITFETTDDLVRKSYRHHFGLRNFFHLVLLYATFGFVVTLVVVGFIFGQDAAPTTLVVLTVGGLLAGSYYWYGYTQSRKASLAALAKLPDRTQSCTFTDDQL